MGAELEPEVWSRFGHDPRSPQHERLRASDADRAVAADVLSQAYAEGRLDRDELDERQDELRRRRSLGELLPLLRDLVPDDAPPPGPTTASLRAEAEAQYRERLVGALTGFLLPTVICWFVWASVMLGGFPWPIFVTLGTAAAPIGMLAAGKERQVARIQRQLQQQELETQERAPGAADDRDA